MRAAEHERVDPGVAQRRQVLLGDGEHLGRVGDTGLDELDEPRAGLGEDRELRVDLEHVLVGARADRAGGADHADPAVARRRHRGAHRGADHLDDRNVVALARVAQHRRGGGVARDHEHLHALVDERVEDLERVPADVGDRLRTVRRARGVADVEERLARQLRRDRPGDGEPADPGVEDADRRVFHDESSLPAASDPRSSDRSRAATPQRHHRVTSSPPLRRPAR